MIARRVVRALGYFTVVPVPPADGPPTPGDVALLPAIGGFVGLTSGAIGYAASRIATPRVAAAIACAAPIALTGALHLDGFLDTCDAAFASVDNERRRQILRDPRHGSYAFAGGSILVVTTYAALRDIAPNAWPRALALALATARYAALLAARSARASDGGTAARAFAAPPSQRALALQGACLLALAYVTAHRRGVAVTLAVPPLALATARVLARRFDESLGGDAYGFLICVAEIATLVALAPTRAR